MKKVILTIIIALTGMITAQAQRFALIDMEYILKHIPAYEQANRQMESLSQQYQKEIEANLYKEREKLVRIYERIKNEIKTYENNLGFLNSSSKKGNSLVNDIARKIEKLKNDLNLTLKKIEAIDETMNN